MSGFSGGPNRDDQEDMAEAIERLAAVLKTSSGPDLETSRQVRDIQDQITQMLEEDRDDDMDDSESEYMDGLVSSGRLEEARRLSWWWWS